MIYPTLYLDYLYHFHGDRDYFECHEVLERHWKENGMGRDTVWVGLIQVAVSFYHYRRGNIRGALKMADKAIHSLEGKRMEVFTLGLHYDNLLNLLYTVRCRMVESDPYVPVCLPVIDKELLQVCKEKARHMGVPWGMTDIPVSDFIRNRHTARRITI